MKRTELFTLFILTLWLGAANHCILEGVFSDHSGVSPSSFGENCPSHGPDDSQEHQEGARCSVYVTTEVKKLIVEQYAEVFAELPAAVFVLNAVNSWTHYSADLLPAMTIPDTSSSAELLATLVSPNAPPVSLFI